MRAASTMTSPSTPPAPPPPPLRVDARVMGLVGLGHGISHFNQLLLPPLFFMLKDAFGVGYAELGFLLTLFFVVSCSVQALSGFVVDRHGPRPVLFGGLALLALATFGYAASTSYAMLAVSVVVAGIGNGVFHPVDYTLLNKRIHPSRLGHAFSVHGITGSLGWGLAPLVVVPVALATNWRVAYVVAGSMTALTLLVLWLQRAHLHLPATASGPAAAAGAAGGRGAAAGSFSFLAIPAVWACFAFFFLYAVVISGVQAFAPEAARQLHDVPVALSALCITVYMVASACGMVVGGFLASDPARCERIVAAGIGAAAVVALVIGYAPLPAWSVPVLFALMGVAAGVAGPSRDIIVKKSTPPNATGRVYGVVYSGLDIGQAIAPLFFGPLMDLHRPALVWLGVAIAQVLLIATAVNVRRARRVDVAPAVA